jgi:hypothetical protein
MRRDLVTIDHGNIGGVLPFGGDIPRGSEKQVTIRAIEVQNSVLPECSAGAVHRMPARRGAC